MGSIPNLSILKGPQRDFHPTFLHKLFEEIAAKNNDEIAILYNNNFITYKQLNEASNQVARFVLRNATVNRLQPNAEGDWIVAICVEPSEKLLILLLAIWKSGAAYLPLDPSFPQSRFQHILNEAKPFLLICDKSIDGATSETPWISTDDILREASSSSTSNLDDDVKPLNDGKNDLAIVLYTSGSTGIPKGVRILQSTVLNRLRWQWEKFPYSKSEKTGVFKTSLTFVDSVSEIWGPLLTGMALLVIPKHITMDPEKLIGLLDKFKIERLVLVPTLLRSMLMFLSMTKEKKILTHLKHWICSGEPLCVSLAKEFYNYFNNNFHVLYNFYGSTEVMGDVTFFICKGKSELDAMDIIPIGTPVDNTVIYLLDSDYRPVKRGDIGEIFVTGLNLAAGYVNGRDANRFIENPLAIDSKYSRLYRTGDFGKIVKENILYEGRTDSQIKIRGHRVDLSEIEKCLSSIDLIEKSSVLCYHVGEIDQCLLAFVTARKSFEQFSGLQIETLLKTKLPFYMVPQVIIREEMPYLVNGKIDRQALLKSYENTNNNDDNNVQLDFNYEGIADDLRHVAKDIFEVIGSVIGRSTRTSLSLKSNFYCLGGNSLNSVYTVTLLRAKGYEISISEFIGARNLGEILTMCSKTKQEGEMNSNVFSVGLSSVPLKVEHKQKTIDIITSSFYGKADLEQWLKPDILATDYADILEEIWLELVGKGLSFVVENNAGNIIAVALNFDAHDEPQVDVKSKLVIVFDFLEHIEGPIRDNLLPTGLNKVLHSFMMGTSEELTAQENVMVMHFMESEVLRIAREKKFFGILTTNTNPLTQQLGSNVYNYKTMLDYQVNTYIHHDGKMPFAAAPDSQRALVHWKEIAYNNDSS